MQATWNWEQGEQDPKTVLEWSQKGDNRDLVVYESVVFNIYKKTKKKIKDKVDWQKWTRVVIPKKFNRTSSNDFRLFGVTFHMK